MSRKPARVRVVAAGGQLRAVYDDRLRGLLDRATPVFHVKRASHVEPGGGGWTADMGPVGGPVLGPFPLRADALAAEQGWLRQERGL